MARLMKRTRAGKAGGRKRNEPAGNVPFAIRAPVYAAALGLLAVYANGYLSAGLGPLCYGLIGITAMAELLKPAMGELLARALEARDAVAQRIIAFGALMAMLIGVAGGLNAMNVSDAPRAQRAAIEREFADARRVSAEAQGLVDAVPACSPEMPAVRCARMVGENAPLLAERRARAAEAKTAEAQARARLDLLPVAGAGLPEVSIWLKALFTFAAEFLISAIPFAAARLSARAAAVTKESKASTSPAEPCGSRARPSEAAIAEAVQPMPKVNDGGWQSRREKYGPSGRKRRGGAGLKLVGGG